LKKLNINLNNQFLKMALLPMSRNAMQMLKAQRDEENRIREVNLIVQTIYTHAVNTATTTTYKTYQHAVQSSGNIINTNIGDVISGLQALFPDCTVERTHLTLAQDGKMYDMSKMDPSVLPFITIRSQSQEYIVIDWS